MNVQKLLEKMHMRASKNINIITLKFIISDPDLLNFFFDINDPMIRISVQMIEIIIEKKI